MASQTPPAAVLESVEELAPPGTPLTTSEVAAEFDCTDRTIYNKLDALVDVGDLETKKVGARGRVWWRPVGDHEPARHDSGATVAESTFRRLFENVPGLYLIVEPEEYEIVAVSDAYLDATMTERAEIMGKTLFEVFPADPDDPDPEGVPRLRGSLERVKAEQETDVMPVTFYPIPRPDAEGDEFEDRWWSPTNAPVVDESGDINCIIHRVQDVTPVVRRLQADGGEAVLDRLDTRDSHLATDIMLRGQELHEAKEAAYERLQENEARLNAFVTATSEVVYRMSPDWTELTELEGRGFIADTNEPRTAWFEEYIPPDEQPRVKAAIDEAIETKSTFELEHQVLQVDGTRGWIHSRAVPILDEDGDVVEWFGTATDVHEARTAKAGLERLTAASRELMEADAAAIADRVAALTQRVLGAEHVSLWRYDGTNGHLRQHDGRADAGVGSDAIRYPEGFDDRIWEVFVSGDVVVTDDHPVDGGADGSLLRSCVLVPLGRHGVVCAGSTQPGAFDERRVELAATLGTTVETAWDRAAGERELADSNEELRRLDRLNTLIRETIQVLVEADTVDAIDEAVCDRLADSDLYEFAWVGEYDAVDDAVEPRAWAGVAGHHLDTLTAMTDERPTDVDALRAAIETGEPQVVADVATDARAAPWRECALDRGARSCLCIPLVYEESVYGVLTVYGERPQRDERDVDVLVELGRTMAHAINAVETKATLRTDSVVELTLRSSGATMPLCRLARDLDCHLEFEGLVPGTGGDHAVFFSAADVPTETIIEAGERTVAVENLTCLADDGADALFRMRTTDRTLASLLLERDVVIRSLSIDAGTATAVIDLFQTDEVREVVDAVETAVPDVTLLARRTQNRPIETRETFQRQMEERLTDRQREVIGFAYRSGFFRSPRVQTGAELSAALDVSQSTFTHHLREAQRKLFEMVFDAP